MTTIKLYTDLEQSKKLAKILPFESADFWYSRFGNSKYDPTLAYNDEQWFLCLIRNSIRNDIPCWSLAALLNILPYPQLSKDKLGNGEEGWMVSAYPYDCRYDSCWYNNPIDACVDMVIKLYELKML